MHDDTGEQGTRGQGILTVVRDHGRRDQLRNYKIWIDGIHRGEVPERATKSFPLTAGVHEVRLTLDWCKSKTVDLSVGGGGSVTLYCRPTAGRVLAPLLRRTDYVDLGFSPWAENSPYGEQWGRRYALAFGGALAVIFVELVVLVVDSVDPTATGVVVAASAVVWMCACILTDIPLRWTRGKRAQNAPARDA
jgi:hypothetical protein